MGDEGADLLAGRNFTFGLRDAQFCTDSRERYLIVFEGHRNQAGWASAEGGRREADLVAGHNFTFGLRDAQFRINHRE